MDPTAALAELRTLMTDPEPDSDRMAELFTGLDQWITRGGFLPQQWSR